jgi:hypothetical protein
MYCYVVYYAVAYYASDFGENMKTITYIEAANILDISVQTLKQALEPQRSALTRAGRRGNSGLLIEEQVRLFVGINPRTGKRKRLSLNALSSDEQTLWHRYAAEAMQQTTLQATPEVRHFIRELLKEELENQELARIRAEKRSMGELEERFLKAHPKLRESVAI